MNNIEQYSLTASGGDLYKASFATLAAAALVASPISTSADEHHRIGGLPVPASYVSNFPNRSDSSYEYSLHLYQSIDEISQLTEGWDGYSAPGFSDNVIDSAKKLLGAVKDSISGMSIFPTMRASIQFEWEVDKYYAEVEIFEGEMHLYAEESGEELLSLSSSDYQIIRDEFVGLYDRSRG